jgi:hypothetical protein
MIVVAVAPLSCFLFCFIADQIVCTWPGVFASEFYEADDTQNARENSWPGKRDQNHPAQSSNAIRSY